MFMKTPSQLFLRTSKSFFINRYPLILKIGCAKFVFATGCSYCQWKMILLLGGGFLVV